jgi:hypothetical protein
MLRRVWTWFHHSDLENARHANIMLGVKMRELEAVALEMAREVYDLPRRPDVKLYRKFKTLWVEDPDLIRYRFPLLAILKDDIRWKADALHIDLLIRLETLGVIKRKLSK